MKKFINVYRRTIAMIAIVLMSINTYATTASNDGSSFITKAEFDSLMNKFNENMDNYQSGLNAKIDNAISNYISGASGMSREVRDIALPDSVVGVPSISTRSTLDYKYCGPIVKGNFFIFGKGNDRRMTELYCKFSGGPGIKGNKTAIDDIYELNNSGGATAKFDGYYEDVLDEIYATKGSIDNGDWLSTTVGTMGNTKAIRGAQTMVTSNAELVGSRYTLFSMVYMEDANMPLHPQLINICGDGFSTDWGKRKYKYVNALMSYNYDMFSHKTKYRNFGYAGDYMKVFNGFENKKTITAHNTTDAPFFPDCIGSSMEVIIKWERTEGDGTTTNIAKISPTLTVQPIYKNVVNAQQTIYMPMIGFERTYLKNWNQIYNADTQSIASFEKNKHGHESEASKWNILNNSSGIANMSCDSGYPLMKLSAGDVLSYNLAFEADDENYVVWVKDRPFSKGVHPDDDKCMTVGGLTKAEYTKNGYVVTNGKGTINIEAKDDCYIYLKWGKAAADRYEIAGGVLMPEATGVVTLAK